MKDSGPRTALRLLCGLSLLRAQGVLCRRGLLIILGLFGAVMLLGSASAHEEPTSFLELRLAADGVSAVVRASATDLAHDLPAIEPDMLLSPAGATAQGQVLANILRTRLQLTADGTLLVPELRAVTALPATRDVRLELHYAWRAAPLNVGLRCRLFPYDPRHRTFVGFYENGGLERQEIFEGEAESVDFRVGSTQSIGAVVRQYIAAGIHHIFIGPDHILFVVGLLLLGGRVGQLLRIVTAFTLAHSITLALATFGLFGPPASIVEPLIALSIVCVGVHAFWGRQRSDPRLVFAFGFGLVHGFGFASVLQETGLPPHALGWSLLAFNGGVEIGQACIVATVAPLLAFAHRRNAIIGARIVATGALAVTAAGAFWFFQRVIG